MHTKIFITIAAAIALIGCHHGRHVEQSSRLDIQQLATYSGQWFANYDINDTTTLYIFDYNPGTILDKKGRQDSDADLKTPSKRHKAQVIRHINAIAAGNSKDTSSVTFDEIYGDTIITHPTETSNSVTNDILKVIVIVGIFFILLKNLDKRSSF